MLADIDTLESALWAESVGADAIATTLLGYTADTCNQNPPDLDFLQQLLEHVSVPVILEGGVHRPEIARDAIASFGAIASTNLGLEELLLP